MNRLARIRRRRDRIHCWWSGHPTERVGNNDWSVRCTRCKEVWP